MPISSISPVRTMPVGADLQPGEGGVHFRVWAPQIRSVEVLFDSATPGIRLTRESDGYYSGLASHIHAGQRYKYQLDGEASCPDPASRFQPDGPHGFSEVIDPRSFRWTDSSWSGCRLTGQVIYELHLGTFTREGTWLSAADKLPYLRETGITVVEVMPVSTFPGRFGWGYDGVLHYAPVALYGRPDDMRQFVDRAHSIGIGVILDVVYNHVGPDGNYLQKYAEDYFTSRHKTDWGAAINFDGKNCEPVREYFKENAGYWIREFHLDGLRLDATQDIHDDSKPHILSDITQTARTNAGDRHIIIVGENEPQDTCLLRSCDKGGYGLDALWNDDYHHSALVALTGRADAYYTDYRGNAQEFVSAFKYGYLYQGQWYRWQKKRRGTPNFNSPRLSMVTFVENHDQVANSARGLRIAQLTSPGKLKALTAATLLGPGTPMLFQGQEFGSSKPFLFFADHKPDLAQLVRKGRIEFLEQWRSLQMPEMKKCFADPSAEHTFERCKLDFDEVESHHETYRLHRDLLHLRRKDPVISRQGQEGLDGAVLSDDCFVVRFFTEGWKEDRLLVVNLGTELERNPAPEPLLAPPEGTRWNKLWSSEDPQYGGCGTASLDSDENWRIPGEAAVLLHPVALLPSSSISDTNRHRK